MVKSRLSRHSTYNNVNIAHLPFLIVVLLAMEYQEIKIHKETHPSSLYSMSRSYPHACEIWVGPSGTWSREDGEYSSRCLWTLMWIVLRICFSKDLVRVGKSLLFLIFDLWMFVIQRTSACDYSSELKSRYIYADIHRHMHTHTHPQTYLHKITYIHKHTQPWLLKYVCVYVHIYGGFGVLVYANIYCK